MSWGEYYCGHGYGYYGEPIRHNDAGDYVVEWCMQGNCNWQTRLYGVEKDYWQQLLGRLAD